MKKKGKRKFFIAILIIILFSFFLIKNISLNSHIKVITSFSGTWTFNNELNYYQVTKFGNNKCDKFNGNAEKYLIINNSSEFTIESDDETTLSTAQYEKLANYVKNINQLITSKKLTSPSLGNLYVVNNRFFVSVLDNTPKKTYYDILFEYDVQNNTLKEITKFKGQDIEQIYLES